MATTKITQVGKRIVNDSSLIFYYDMTNTIRSFKGKPTTNLFAGYVNQYDTWTTSSIEFTYYDPLPEVKMTETSANVGHYVLKDTTLTDDTEYTQSIYVKPVEREHFQISPSTGFPVSLYANFTLTGEGSISGTGASKATIKLIKSGRYSGWYRCTYTETSTSPGAGRMAYAVINSASATRLVAYAGTPGSGVLILDPQLEASSFATPFIDGTRSNTQAIIDLTGNETVTANSLTYNSDGTFRFGNGQYITLPNAATTFGTGSVSTSVEFWIRPIDDTDTTRIPVGHQNVSGERFYIGITGSNWDVGWGGFGWNDGFTGTRPTADYDIYQHICVTINAGVVSLYKNGVKSTFSKTETTVTQSGVFPIGTYFSGGSPSGAYYGIDDIPIFRIYSRALSEAEVKQNFIAHRKQFGL
jgi:hypothetical protein